MKRIGGAAFFSFRDPSVTNTNLWYVSANIFLEYVYYYTFIEVYFRYDS